MKATMSSVLEERELKVSHLDNPATISTKRALTSKAHSDEL